MNIYSFFHQYFYKYCHLIKNDHKYISAIQTWLFSPPKLAKWKVYTNWLPESIRCCVLIFIDWLSRGSFFYHPLGYVGMAAAWVITAENVFNCINHTMAAAAWQNSEIQMRHHPQAKIDDKTEQEWLSKPGEGEIHTMAACFNPRRMLCWRKVWRKRRRRRESLLAANCRVYIWATLLEY